MQRQTGPQYYRDCSCGANLWQNCLPTPFERIVCMCCGNDASRAPTLRQRWKWGTYQLRRRRDCYGLRGMLARGLLDAFRLPRERDDRAARRKRAESPAQ